MLIGKDKDSPQYLAHLYKEEPTADTENVIVVHLKPNM